MAYSYTLLFATKLADDADEHTGLGAEFDVADGLAAFWGASLAASPDGAAAIGASDGAAVVGASLGGSVGAAVIGASDGAAVVGASLGGIVMAELPPPQPQQARFAVSPWLA